MSPAVSTPSTPHPMGKTKTLEEHSHLLAGGQEGVVPHKTTGQLASLTDSFIQLEHMHWELMVGGRVNLSLHPAEMITKCPWGPEAEKELCSRALFSSVSTTVVLNRDHEDYKPSSSQGLFLSLSFQRGEPHCSERNPHCGPHLRICLRT